MAFFAHRNLGRLEFRIQVSRRLRASRRSTRRFTPALAGLESRALLSTVTVTSDADSGPGRCTRRWRVRPPARRFDSLPVPTGRSP